MTCKERWHGTTLMHEDFKPKTYARKNNDNEPVMLDQRAEATAEYLAEKTWSPSRRSIGGQRAEEYVKNHLEINRTSGKVPQIEDGPITRAELQTAIRKMKRHKAPGPDHMTTDWLKDLDDFNKVLLLQLLNDWWSKGHMPEQMREARVASLYKKWEPNVQENYRPISLLNLLFKIIAAVIKIRLKSGLEGDIMGTQFGFRAGRRTTHAIHIARRIQEFAERAGIVGTMIFLDWEQHLIK